MPINYLKIPEVIIKNTAEDRDFDLIVVNTTLR
jgi:hypothetical protein